MDASHLGEQIERSIDQLHIFFDEIGVQNHEREKRETELFVALSEALNRYVSVVGSEKKDLMDEAKRTIVAIRQMETSLKDPDHDTGAAEHEDFKITFPLVRCLQTLRDKHAQVARLHKERAEQVMKLAEALESYASHLEPSWGQFSLPPLAPGRSIPLTFDLSPSYVQRLNSYFNRVFEEYTNRLAAVQTLGEQIVQLWADLGVPQAQQDAAVSKYYRDAPEQLGLHEEDIKRFSVVRDKLAAEKKSREERLQTLKTTIEDLWEKLGVNEQETKAFLKENEGCGISQISEFEAELARLNELKRQNLQFFIEDTRITLQELWDSLYFSEDDMLEFTPAFSDAYSDALLEAHEREVKRLVALKEERAPTLSAVAKYKSLIKDRDELIASSQDSSRLMLRGQKGEKRDPGKLLREEKMRKRVAKELPRVLVEVKKALEQWEEENGKPFLVYGERFLDELEAEEETATTKRPARTRTPAPAVTAIRMPGSAQARATISHANTAPPLKSVSSRTLLKTPSAHEAATKKVIQSQQGLPSQATLRRGARDLGSPTKVPSRVPLSNLSQGLNSPERRPQQPQQQQQSQQQQQPPRQGQPAPARPDQETQVETMPGGAPMRAPPPKMRSLKSVPELSASVSSYSSMGLQSATASTSNLLRSTGPDDLYDDRARPARSVHSNSSLSQRPVSSHSTESFYSSSIRLLPPLPPLPHAASKPQQQHCQEYQKQQEATQAQLVGRHTSFTSQATTLSGSENWETYDDFSEPEEDVSEEYYSKMKAAGEKRLSPSQGHRQTSGPPKRVKGPRLPAGFAAPVVVDDEGQRLAPEEEWVEEDTF